MTEKEFKKIITDIDTESVNKEIILGKAKNLIDKITNSLHPKIKIKEYLVSGYNAFGITYNEDVIYIYQ